MDWPTIVLTGLSVLLGGWITRYYARQGERRLREEADNLRKLNGLTIRILDEAKLLPDNVKPAKDEAGNYTGGLSYTATAISYGRASARATGRVTRAEDSGNQEPQDSSRTAKEEPDEG